jgi:LemA protein
LTTFISIVVILVIVWVIILYNLLVKDRNLIKEAWSGIDVQLKRRYNLVPNLVETVKGYTQHERNLFIDITKKRANTIKADKVGDKATAETDLSGMIKTLFAVVENYPDLKANENFLDLQKQLVEIEDQLQYARRYYNGAVRNYNIRVESFPGNLVANILKFKPEEFFEITLATERESPEVKL